MKKETLLEEIGRIKKLSGINEAAAPGPTQWIAKLIAQIQKTPLSDEAIKEFEMALVSKGKMAIDKASKTIRSIDWNSLTDDEVKLIFRSDTMVDIFEEIIKKENISLDAAAVSLYSPRFKKIVNGYIDGKAAPRIGGSGAGSSSSHVLPDPSNTTTHTEPPKVGDKGDQLIAATEKSNPKAAAYFAQIDDLHFPDNIKKQLKLEYSKIGHKPLSEIIAEGDKLSQSINQAKYGWLKRGWLYLSKQDPAKVGKNATKILYWFTILSIVSAGAVISFALRDKIMKFLNLEDKSIWDYILGGSGSGGNSTSDDDKADIKDF